MPRYCGGRILRSLFRNHRLQRRKQRKGEVPLIGFSVQSIERGVGPEFVRKYRWLPVANVSDCMSRLTGAGHGCGHIMAKV
jgi:hypothetical protein